VVMAVYDADDSAGAAFGGSVRHRRGDALFVGPPGSVASVAHRDHRFGHLGRVGRAVEIARSLFPVVAWLFLQIKQEMFSQEIVMIVNDEIKLICVLSDLICRVKCKLL